MMELGASASVFFIYPSGLQPLAGIRGRRSPFPIKFRDLGYRSCRPQQRPPQASAISPHAPGDGVAVRRSANYQPPTWDYDRLQSLSSDIYIEDSLRAERINELKGKVEAMLECNEGLKGEDQLELIDVLQRLGVSYHFERKIESILSSVHHGKNKYDSNHGTDLQDLYTAALEFRLLRQHGHHVPWGVFEKFRDEGGNFKACICKDTKGILALYEASFLSIEGESLLDEARDFAARQLKETVRHHERNGGFSSIDGQLATQAKHALELPLHWRMQRLYTRWFIELYQTTQDANSILVELAKLDFNMVQATHRQDLVYGLGWWKSTGLFQKLSFARNRMVENVFWTAGIIYEPQFGNYRRKLSKINALITTIDDVYDIYGTPDELQLFTDAVTKWDTTAMDQLPNYMKICFLCLYNSINEMAYDVLKDEDVFIIPYLRKAWADFCEALLVEAKWYYTGYTPTLQEYIENAWISASAPMILAHAYVNVVDPISKESLGCLDSHHEIIQSSAIILRLANDLGTSSDELERGDVPKSIQCYMHEMGASEEEARGHLKHLIGEAWKKMNKSCLEQTPSNCSFVKVAMNLARTAQCVYQYGDGQGNNEHNVIRSGIMSLLIEPYI